MYYCMQCAWSDRNAPPFFSNPRPPPPSGVETCVLNKVMHTQLLLLDLKHLNSNSTGGRLGSELVVYFVVVK